MKGKMLSPENTEAVHTSSSIKERGNGIDYKDKSLKIDEASNHGITLVALVVTIVVLLILAGITLVYVFGDNGVFQKAQEAKSRTENAIEDEKVYMNDTGNMVDKYTNGVGNGGTTNPPEQPDVPTSPEVSDSSSSNHTATDIDYTWEQINKIAEAISNSSSVNSSTMEVTANVDGSTLKIGVGDIATVQYSGEERRVRVLGFKHDDLVDTGAYGGSHTKASISFEFLDFMTGYTYMQMNTSNTNSGGWGSAKLRTDLNGSGSSIGGLGANLNNKAYIKQVKKKYIPTYNTASTNTTNDYLWLLSCSEVVPKNSDTTTTYKYAFAVTSEGNQYQYYKGVTEAWNATSTGRTKYNGLGSAEIWWLRSPLYSSSGTFGGVNASGNTNLNGYASHSNGVAPGFCI